MITGAGAVRQIGAGTTTLTGANTYAGLTTVIAGTLEVTVDSALGTIAAGTSVSSGAALKLTAVTYSAAEALTINGTGVSNGGALVNSGSSSFAGSITAATDASISAGGGALTLTGGLVKNGTTLTLTGGGTINVNTVGISGINGLIANSDLVVDGVTLNANVANTYNGPTFIRSTAGFGTGIFNALVVNALPTLNGRSAVTMDGSGSLGGSRLNLSANQAAASLTGAASSLVDLNGNTLTVGSSSGLTTFAGVMSGVGGGLTKDGLSAQILTGTNTYTGGTSVTGGVLQVGVAGVGSTHADSAVNLNGTAVTTILAGTGTVGGDTLVTSGTIAPGDSLGSDFGLLSFGKALGSTGGTILDFKIGGLDRGTSYDALNIGGAFTYGGALNLNFSSTFSDLDAWNLFDFGTSEGSFNAIAFTGSYTGSLSNGGSGIWTGTFGLDLFEFNQATGVLRLDVIPEPSRAMLVLVGLGSLMLRRRRGAW